MKKNKDDIGYWAGWFAAFAVAGTFFIFVVTQSQSLKSLACSENETDCFRQWVSALGNWSAVAIAIPSLLFLSRQIRDADRHHKRSAALTLRRLRSLAFNVHGSSKNASAVAYTWMVLFSGSKGGNIPLLNKREELVGVLDEAMKLLTDKNFEIFEAEIYLPADHALFLCETIQAIKDDVVGQPEWLDGKSAMEIAKRLHEAHAFIKLYMDDVAANAERFLQDTSEYASLSD